MGRKVSHHQKRMCTDTKSDTKAKRHQVYPKTDESKKDNLMLMNWERKGNKEGHKRPTTQGARDEIKRMEKSGKKLFNLFQMQPT